MLLLNALGIECPGHWALSALGNKCLKHEALSA
jgi:hypothetical protein